MTGVEIAIGYLFAWAVRKARLAAGRADGEVDRMVNAGMDRLHEVVSRKLGDDPAFHRLTDEAASGHELPSERTRQRVRLALEEANETDPDFAVALERAVAHLRSVAPQPGAPSGGDHIEFQHNTFHGPVQAKGIQHIDHGDAS
ncbi:hypothetical protein GCM10010331_77250 [Streptomyces xanthochromogenes]|uniref:chromosome partitioning protein n=1 Tax=Streptomyces xanthochromogenes TaxID=67384 RepID=UPI0016736F86|nr:chromosome partitioning protein [Streptomyces xanthochromogenes]GHB78138.1 hypothetical protein GCM10010331_77250 [Streptomyces xanthochromogenes]